MLRSDTGECEVGGLVGEVLVYELAANGRPDNTLTQRFGRHLRPQYGRE